MNILKNLENVKLKISEALQKRNQRFKKLGKNCITNEEITIVLASKYINFEQIVEIYKLGFKIFGENKVQELKQKYESIKLKYPEILNDLKFHMIGHLQTNKVKDAVLYSSMIQSVDSIKLATKINDYCIKNSKILDVLIELKTSNEETKTGINIEDAYELAQKISELSNLKLVGVMTMAPLTNDQNIIKKSFEKAYNFFEELNLKHKTCNILSMGMSDDYELAIECGANMIRLGRILLN